MTQICSILAEWEKKAQDAGIKYAVITTKHHKGFCMFESDYNDYDVMNAFYGQDIKDWVEAFRADLKDYWRGWDFTASEQFKVKDWNEIDGEKTGKPVRLSWDHGDYYHDEYTRKDKNNCWYFEIFLK